MKIIGKLYNEGDVVEVSIDGEKISAINPVSNPTEQELKQIILPGLVDMHVHFREPGFENSETIETGSMAAAAGGFTCVFPMANTDPVTDTASSVEQTLRRGNEVGLVQVQPIGAVTHCLKGEKMADLGAMARSKAKVRVFSDDGKCVFDPLIMRRSLEYIKAFDGVIAEHAQEPRLTEGSQMNEGKWSAKLGLNGWPAVAEESIIARDILLADFTKSRVHICHLSTKKSVDIVRFAKSKGLKVTAEATPHHLNLTEEELSEYNPRYKVNPPLRTREDVEAVRQGVADGTIDIIATDHAPHALELKYAEFQDAAFGMTGLETSLSASQLALIDTGLMNWRQLMDKMSVNPAKIGGVDDRQGRDIKVGEIANLCVYDPTVKQEIIPESQFTRSTNSPFKHKILPGKVLKTVWAGKTTFENGEIVR